MEVTINCPHGHDDCEWCNEARHNFDRALKELDPYRGPTMKDDHGRCAGCGNTGWATDTDAEHKDVVVPCDCERGERAKREMAIAYHTVGMPGLRGKRGGIE